MTFFGFLLMKFLSKVTTFLYYLLMTFFTLLLGTQIFCALVLPKWLLIAVETTLVQNEYISITL